MSKDKKNRMQMNSTDVQLLMQIAHSRLGGNLETLIRRKSIEWLVRHDLVKTLRMDEDPDEDDIPDSVVAPDPDEVCYVLTLRGEVLVNDIVSVKLPVQKWVSNN